MPVCWSTERSPDDDWNYSDSHRRQTLEERQAVAGQCEAALQYGIRTCVDELDDAVNKVYAAWPTRLYLVGLDGRVAYAGGLGPFGFKPAALGAAIEDFLAQGVAGTGVAPVTAT